MYGKAPAKLNFMTSISPAADTSEGPLPGGHWRFRDEDQRAVSQFRAGDGAMIFMVLATVAHANQIGSSISPTGRRTSPKSCVFCFTTPRPPLKARPGGSFARRSKPDRCPRVPFRAVGRKGHAGPRCVCKGWRAPQKIVSDFVGIVHRGTDAADHAVIVDATMRHALANGDKQMAGPQATPKRICALQKDMAAL